jgi:hypothetical protein
MPGVLAGWATAAAASSARVGLNADPRGPHRAAARLAGSVAASWSGGGAAAMGTSSAPASNAGQT